MPGRDGVGDVVELARAGRAAADERHDLKGALDLVLALLARKEIEQLGQPHGRVAADRERDGDGGEPRVAAVRQRRERRGRVVEQVHLAVDNGQQRLRPVMLLARGLGELGGRGHAAEMAARVAPVVLRFEERAYLLVGLECECEVVGRRGVGLGRHAERGFGRDGCRLEVAHRDAARSLARRLVRSVHALGDGTSRAQLRLAHHELGAHDDEAARHASKRDVERAIARCTLRLLLDLVNHAHGVVPVVAQGQLAGGEGVQMCDALDDARHKAGGRIVRSRIADGKRPDHLVVSRRFLQVSGWHARSVHCDVGRVRR